MGQEGGGRRLMPILANITLSGMLGEVGIVLLVVLFLGLSIFVHEFGHYIAARLCGMVVDVFSIGFGAAIWKKKHKGIVYKIGWIPLGGYVALPQLDPSGMARIQGTEGNEDGEPEPLPPIATWKKIVVSIAGGVGNIVLAFLVAWLVYAKGMPANGMHASPIVGNVATNKPAFEAGLRPGDEVLSVNGDPVKKWLDIMLSLSATNSFLVKSVSDGEERTLIIPATNYVDIWQLEGVSHPDLCTVKNAKAGMSAKEAGILPRDRIIQFDGANIYSISQLQSLVGTRENKQVPITVARTGEAVQNLVTPKRVTMVNRLSEDSQAFKAGLRLGDQILTVNGKAIYTKTDLALCLAPTNSVEFKSSSDGETKVLTLLAKKQKAAWVLKDVGHTTSVLIGIEFDDRVHPRPSEQLSRHATLVFRVLKGLVTPKRAKKTSKQVGGPAAIVLSFRNFIKVDIMLAVWFIGLLNVNLAILNLLPIPVLDGGHIVFASWEGLTGRPVNPKFLNVIVNLFFVLLLSLLLFMTYRDINRGIKLRRFRRLEEERRTAKLTNTVPSSARQRVATDNVQLTPQTSP